MDTDKYKVSCYIGSDIGNELFRIAATLDYANKYKKCEMFQSDNDNVKKLWDTFFCDKVNIVNILDMKQNDFEYFTESRRDIYEEIPAFDKNVMMVGKFQSYHYISPETRLRMRDLVYSNENYMYDAYDEYNKIKKHFDDDCDDNFVCIYVKKTSELCDDYYNRAYEVMCELGNDKKHIVVFSDDIEWCKKNITLGDRHDRQYFATFQNKCIELIVMSMFYHNILSNSTFGWWGAYLSNHNAKLVVVPERWVSNSITIPGMRLPEWKAV